MNYRSKITITIFILSLILSNYHLTAQTYKGAEYRTNDAYTYGRFEVSLKSAHREGILSSFFTYFDGTEEDPWSSSKWNEIDLEIMGRYDDNVQFNTITPGQINHVGHFPTSFSPHLDFHTYAFEWTPDYVAWFVDGTEVLRQTGLHIQTLTRPQKIMMNIWNPQYENWAGVFDPVTLPAFAYYDWLSYYKFTPDSGNYGTGNNFTHSWTDNFDSWDTTRWDKGTHTFPGNGCQFVKENAVFQDGKLILCLTNSTNVGYTDLAAPSVLWARTNSVNKIILRFSEEVNKSDAETVSKYIIIPTSVSVTGATLQTDLKTVELNVNGLNLSNANQLIVNTIRDRAPVPNLSQSQLRSVIISQPLSFPIKINCGGPSELNYLADAAWNHNSEYGFMDGNNFTYDSSLEITGTDEDIIYRSKKDGLAGYKIRLPNGSYNVKLMFAENDYDLEDQRIFDVYLERNRVIENLDIYQQAGKNAALIKEFSDVQVNDEVLDIQFADKVNSAMINGIVITANTTDVNDENDLGLKTFKVEQNYPNPFNGKTVINYYLPFSSNISFGLYNLLGEQIFFKDLGFKPEGNHQYLLDTFALKELPLSSGIYFYSISTFNRTEIRKMVLIN